MLLNARFNNLFFKCLQVSGVTLGMSLARIQEKVCAAEICESLDSASTQNWCDLEKKQSARDQTRQKDCNDFRKKLATSCSQKMIPWPARRWPRSNSTN